LPLSGYAIAHSANYSLVFLVGLFYPLMTMNHSDNIPYKGNVILGEYLFFGICSCFGVYYIYKYIPMTDGLKCDKILQKF